MFGFQLRPGRYPSKPVGAVNALAAALFRNGEQGWWFDNNDLSTMFKDSAGTTPVTAAGQPVGLQLDKSRGLVRGPELVANGDFSAGIASWVGSNEFATLSVSGGVLRVTRSGSSTSAVQLVPVQAGKTYFVTASGRRTAGSATYRVVVTTSPDVTLSPPWPLATFSALLSNATDSACGGWFVSTVTGQAYIHLVVAGADGSVDFDNISVRELPGNHRFQATAASRPILQQNAATGFHYLETDGSDDWMVTNSIDFTGTDKVTLFTGVRKLSDVAAGVLIELSAIYSTNSGTFGVFAPGAAAPRFDFVSRGVGGTAAGAVASGFTAPISAVLTGVGVVSTDTMLLRVNGSQAAQNTADQGTGNYGNHPAYFFRRGGTTLPFNGHEYSSICVGRLCTAAEIGAIERLLAQRTGVQLA